MSWSNAKDLRTYGRIVNPPRNAFNRYADDYGVITSDACTQERKLFNPRLNEDCTGCGLTNCLGCDRSDYRTYNQGDCNNCGLDNCLSCSRIEPQYFQERRYDHPNAIYRAPQICTDDVCKRSPSFLVGGKPCYDITNANAIIGNMTLNTKSVDVIVARSTVLTPETTISTIIPIIMRPMDYPRSVEISGGFCAPPNIWLDGLHLNNLNLSIEPMTSSSASRKVKITDCLITGNDTCIINKGGELTIDSCTFDVMATCKPVIDHLCGMSKICGCCGDVTLCSNGNVISTFVYQREDGMEHMNNALTFHGDDNSVVFGVKAKVKAEYDMNTYLHDGDLTYHCVLGEGDDDCCRDPCCSIPLPDKKINAESYLGIYNSVYKPMSGECPKATLYDGFSDVLLSCDTLILEKIKASDCDMEIETDQTLEISTSTVKTTSCDPVVTMNTEGKKATVSILSSTIQTDSRDYVFLFTGDENSEVEFDALGGSVSSKKTKPQVYYLDGIEEENSILFNGPFSLVHVDKYSGNSVEGEVITDLDTD